MRFSSIIASSLVFYIATVSAQSEYTHESQSQTSHLMARGAAGLGGLGGLGGITSGLPLLGGQKKATKKTKKVKKVKKVKNVKKGKGKKGMKSGAVKPASPHPAVDALPKSTGATKAQMPM